MCPFLEGNLGDVKLIRAPRERSWMSHCCRFRRRRLKLSMSPSKRRRLRRSPVAVRTGESGARRSHLGVQKTTVRCQRDPTCKVHAKDTPQQFADASMVAFSRRRAGTRHTHCRGDTSCGSVVLDASHQGSRSHLVSTDR